jgi:vacuolar protein sorting-associated protein VTA1
VYARADKHDVRSAQTATPTQTQVEAFSAAGTFLKTLDQSQFAGMYDEDLKRRQEYAEWRAWDLATAMHAGRQPSPVAGHAGSSSSPVFTAPPSSPPVQVSSPAYPSLESLNVSTPASTTPTRPGSSVSSNAPLPPRPPPPPGAPPPGHRSPSMEPCTSPKSSDDQRWEPRW